MACQQQVAGIARMAFILFLFIGTSFQKEAGVTATSQMTLICQVQKDTEPRAASQALPRAHMGRAGNLQPQPLSRTQAASVNIGHLPGPELPANTGWVDGI